MKAFLDIETIPAGNTKINLLRQIFNKRRSENNFERFHRQTSLNGNWGQIICIGVALDKNKPEICTGTEAEILNKFWDLIKNAQQLIGHNILHFDLPFIFKRSVINKVKPSIEIRSHLNDLVFDTMRRWDGQSKSFTGLDQLAKILGFKTSKQGIDGSQVFKFYKTNRLQEIYNYCLADVELTRKIYYRLTFNEQITELKDYYLEQNHVMEFK